MQAQRMADLEMLRRLLKPYVEWRLWAGRDYPSGRAGRDYPVGRVGIEADHRRG
jgi:hypothetical protein